MNVDTDSAPYETTGRVNSTQLNYQSKVHGYMLSLSQGNTLPQLGLLTVYFCINSHVNCLYLEKFDSQLYVYY